MALDKILFDVLAPELAATPAADLDVITPLAELEVPVGVWGLVRTPHAVALMVAHMLTMSKRNGKVGGVNSSGVGSLSRSFAGLGNINDSLDTTGYGSEFKRIRSQLVITPLCF